MVFMLQTKIDMLEADIYAVSGTGYVRGYLVEFREADYNCKQCTAHDTQGWGWMVEFAE